MNWGNRHLPRRSIRRGILPRNESLRSHLDKPREFCDGITDIAILGILFFAPLMMGGRHPIGKLVYLILVGTFVIAWLVRQTLASKAPYRATNVGWLIGAALLLVLVQLTPLPQQMVAALSPFQATLLPAWSDTAQEISFGNWNRLSLAPFSTRTGLVTLVAHAALFLVAVQWLQSWQQVERLLRWIALAAIAMAAIGLVQYISRTEKFAWFFIHPSREAHRVLCGPFANSNHFSHFLVLGIGPLIWWLHKSWRDQSTGSKFSIRAAQKSSQYIHLALAAALALIVVSGPRLTATRAGASILTACSTPSMAAPGPS